MTPSTPRLRRLATAALLLCAGVAGGLAPARADELLWRQSSVRTETQGMTYVRRGVAMFAGGEPATLVFHGITQPPEGGQQGFSGRMLMRFEDGATFSFEMQGSTRYGPPGTAPVVAATGRLLGGTGRFAGITGTIEFNGRGMDLLADGVLGDIFAAGRANYTLVR